MNDQENHGLPLPGRSAPRDDDRRFGFSCLTDVYRCGAICSIRYVLRLLLGSEHDRSRPPTVLGSAIYVWTMYYPQVG